MKSLKAIRAGRELNVMNLFMMIVLFTSELAIGFCIAKSIRMKVESDQIAQLILAFLMILVGLWFMFSLWKDRNDDTPKMD